MGNLVRNMREFGPLERDWSCEDSREMKGETQNLGSFLEFVVNTCDFHIHCGLWTAINWAELLLIHLHCDCSDWGRSVYSVVLHLHFIRLAVCLISSLWSVLFDVQLRHCSLSLSVLPIALGCTYSKGVVLRALLLGSVAAAVSVQGSSQLHAQV